MSTLYGPLNKFLKFMLLKKITLIYYLSCIHYGLNSIYYPVIINKILTVNKDRKPISWPSIALLTTGIEKCDNQTV